MSQIPNNSLVSDEILTCLSNLLAELNFTDPTIEISQGAKHGECFSGTIAKILTTNKVGGVRNFIIKSASRSENYRAISPIRRAFEREAFVYETILPEFRILQIEKGVRDPFESYAKFYRASLGYLNEAIIMDDMKSYGFVTCERQKTLNYEHVLLVMKEYGKLHALSFALRQTKPSVFRRLEECTPDAFFTGKNGEKFLASVLPGAGLDALSTLDKENDRETYEKFEKFVGNMKESVLGVLGVGAAGDYSVINHGDCWLNNVLFKYDDSSNANVPTKLCLIDWQLSRTGSPALDLSYFIFTSTDKQLREKHYEQLIKEYYASLGASLMEFGSDPETLFPYRVLLEHLKKFSVYGLFMATSVLKMLTSDPEEIPDLHEVSDVGDMTEVLKFETKNVEKYNERMRGVITDYVSYGYEL